MELYLLLGLLALAAKARSDSAPAGSGPPAIAQPGSPQLAAQSPGLNAGHGMAAAGGFAGTPTVAGPNVGGYAPGTAPPPALAVGGPSGPPHEVSSPQADAAQLAAAYHAVGKTSPTGGPYLMIQQGPMIITPRLPLGRFA